jgi:hypothetical protein
VADLSSHFLSKHKALSDTEDIQRRRTIGIEQFGKAIFTDTFASRHNGLTFTRNVLRPEVVAQLGVVQTPPEVSFRATRGGAITARYQFAIDDPGQCTTSIQVLAQLRRLCAESTARYVAEIYPTQQSALQAFGLKPAGRKVIPTAVSPERGSIYAVLVFDGFGMAVPRLHLSMSS